MLLSGDRSFQREWCFIRPALLLLGLMNVLTCRQSGLRRLRSVRRGNPSKSWRAGVAVAGGGRDSSSALPGLLTNPRCDGMLYGPTRRLPRQRWRTPLAPLAAFPATSGRLADRSPCLALASRGRCCLRSSPPALRPAARGAGAAEQALAGA
jgi:hypothetical protein